MGVEQFADGGLSVFVIEGLFLPPMAVKIQTETQPDSDSQASMQPQRRTTHGLADHCGGFLSPNVKMGTIKVIKMDLHGYHPSEIVQTDSDGGRIPASRRE